MCVCIVVMMFARRGSWSDGGTNKVSGLGNRGIRKVRGNGKRKRKRTNRTNKQASGTKTGLSHTHKYTIDNLSTQKQ